MKKIFYLLFLLSLPSFSQEIALLKYSGGGDWYANPTSLPNLISFCNSNINTRIKAKPSTVEPGNPDLLSYPFVHMTGHGNVVFSDSDVSNLRNYLTEVFCILMIITEWINTFEKKSRKYSPIII